MTHACLSITVLTKSLGGVSLTMSLKVSCHFVMIKRVGGISVVRKQQPKFFSVVFIGLLYFGMLLNIVSVALDANS